ncbi:MAG: GldG family protein, partial [Verrucomicrobiales bacterium]|nr:GldG family protein [Verrucomicrobiales bacterium]
MSEKTSSNKSGSSNAKESTAGITALITIAIIIVVNYLVGGVGVGNFRLDLTENKIYTLSEGTEKILARVSTDKPVTIRFYETTDDRIMPSFMKPFARTVEDLLLEFEKAAGDGKVTMEKYFPNPNTDDEDKAREDELQGRQVNQEGDNVYLGFTVQCGGKKEVVPFILPNEETQLEYYVARAINKVISDKPTVIGVMSQIPVQGSPMFPYQRQRGQEPWQIVQQLRRDYEVRDIAMTSDKIDSDVSVLVVIHPGDITEKAEFAIDQYLLKGGKVLAFVDPQCWVAQAYNGQPNPMTGQSTFVAQSSDLPNLFKAWGIGYKKDMVV